MKLLLLPDDPQLEISAIGYFLPEYYGLRVESRYEAEVVSSQRVQNTGRATQNAKRISEIQEVLIWKKEEGKERMAEIGVEVGLAFCEKAPHEDLSKCFK